MLATNSHEVSGDILAFDIGDARIGVARASTAARLAEPLTVLDAHQTDVQQHMLDLCNEHGAHLMVIGLPRGLNGQETAQTTRIRQFVTSLQQMTDLPIVLQDEAVTSHKAEAELTARGKPFAKGDIDALAASYILEDYLSQVPNR